MKSNWNVRELWLKGQHRHAILLHHARESGMMIGHCMDAYMEWRNGVPVVNISLVRRALKEMDRLDRVTRLMYQAGYISAQGFVEFMDINNKNRAELKKNVDTNIMEILERGLN